MYQNLQYYPDGESKMASRRRNEYTFMTSSLALTILVLTYWKIKANMAAIVVEHEDDTLLPFPYQDVENLVRLDVYPRAVLLWGQPFSGTKYVGRLLAQASHQESIISFEPFASEYRPHHAPWANSSTLASRVALLDDLVHCRHHKHKDVVSRITSSPVYRDHNTFLRRRCIGYPEDTCRNATFISLMCHEATVQIIKVLRLPLKWSRPLMETASDSLKILYLTRDPRALIYYRQQDPRCDFEECRDPVHVCAKLLEDLSEVPFFTADFQERFLFMKYEDLAMNRTTTQDILTFALESPVSVGHPANFTADATSWRQKMSFVDVSRVQGACGPLMTALGYYLFSSEEEFRNISIPTTVEHPT